MKIFLCITAILAATIFIKIDSIKYYISLYTHIEQLDKLPKLKSFENLNIHFSFISSNKDLLRDMSLLSPMNNKGKVRVCIIPQVPLSGKMQKHIETLTYESVNDWNKLLNSPGVPWNHQEIQVDFIHASNNNLCDENSDLIFTITAERVRPYAIFLMKSIFIGIDDLREDSIAKTYITHEIGHILGLSDTYSDIESKEIIGYPISIMSTSRHIDKISRSDHEAITQLWNYMNLDIDLCETVDGKNLRTVNWNDSYTCVSKLEFGISSLVWGEDRSLTYHKKKLTMLGTGNEPKQTWVVKPFRTKGGYYFKLRDDNLCLSLFSEQRIALAPCANKQRQIWRVKAWKPMIYYIKSEFLGEDVCLTLHPNSSRLLSMQPCQEYRNLLWMINNQK